MTNKSKLTIFKNDLFTKPKSIIIAELNDAPLKAREVEFMTDIINGASYKELQDKYNLSLNGVYNKKVTCINKLYRYLFYQGKN